MRISDWSSDVCSSDLSINAEDYQHAPRPVAAMPKDYAPGEEIAPHSHRRAQLLYAISGVMRITAEEMPAGQVAAGPKGIWPRGIWIVDRKRVVYGKSVSVRVDLGG